MPLFKKIAILGGAGGVGSTMAFYLGLKNVAAQIALIDVKTNILETHLIDLRECFSEECATEILAGDYGLLTGADLVIMAASQPNADPVASRNDYLSHNLPLVIAAAEAVRDHCPEALVIVTTAPTDVFTLVFQDVLGRDRHKILGFCRNDSQRFRYALSQVLKVDPKRVKGLVLGEHGRTQVPAFSTVTIDQEKVLLSADQKTRVLESLTNWYLHWQAQKSGRTTTWTSATSIHKTLLALAGKIDEPPLGSVVLEGEFGLSDVALGLALTPGTKGWKSVVELDLTVLELRALRASAESVKSLYAQAANPYSRRLKTSVK
ncbi:MAG: hypothetical protein LBI10_11370 [Deltaproteobacteria bacterium]|jgi:malate/lactate dehydrogenase|nr:hypothetical protein [Deltaproteobacteria bacterium]